MKSTVSIGRYIGICVAILITTLIVIYSLTINQVYQWGTYDTTHYFLSLEADRVLDSLRQTGDLPIEPNKDTHYYLERSGLPEVFASVFPAELHQEGELLSHEILGDVVYLLPYQHPETGQFFYISHTYSETDDVYDVGINIPELLILLAISTLVIVIFLVKNLAWSMVTPVRVLEKWATSIVPEEKTRVLLSASQLKFTELNAVADCLNTAVTTLENHNQREKSFLRSLSHELRTPLAVTKAALDLLEKKSDGLDSGHRKKLERMRRANNNMLSITECLLWMWTGKERPLAKEDVPIHGLVQHIVSMNTYLLQRKSVDVVIDISQDLVFRVEKTLLEMVIGNLIRNAFQYSEYGTIKIMADSRQITVNNLVATEPASNSLTNEDYGYGVGLYLVENLCTHKGWLLKVDRNEQFFSVSIMFDRTLFCTQTKKPAH